MTIFRPCIDLHDGQVKQIVGGTLRDDGKGMRTNFVAEQPPQHFVEKYRADALAGGHVIKLGPGNDEAAKAALAAWPGELQLGGGIDIENAAGWLDAGAGKVIVTTWLFPDARFAPERLEALAQKIGAHRLVVDLSCRARFIDGQRAWLVAIDRWQRVTDFTVDQDNIERVARHCSELLVHAADVEGLCKGIDRQLVENLGEWAPLPCTYAGGGKDVSDLMTVDRVSRGAVDLTFGSALDLSGGKQVKYADCVAWNRAQEEKARRGKRA
jgi:phosphoribosylformimino-5-aminoimidazole carboxamide ribotide isomerase